MVSQPWNIVVEGDADEPLARAILLHCSQECLQVRILNGKANLDQRLGSYLAAAGKSPWLIVRDLDHDADCAPTLLARLAPRGDRGPLRIAVRSAEAWLLADAERAAHWLGIARTKIPADVDALPDPKQTLINLARASRRREILLDIVPEVGSTARSGKGYVNQIRSFCGQAWRPDVAARRSDSLQRCLKFVRSRA